MDATDSTSSFYVYLHRRATDGRVFYVGKGAGRRAWATYGRSRYWRNIVARHGFTVEIAQSGMQEWWALELECELIALYGRDTLCNLTDGGEGASGAKRSAETIAKNIALHTGAKRSQESRKKMSDAQKASPNKRDIRGDKNPAKREDVRQKMRKPRDAMRGDKNPMRDPEIKAKFLAAVHSNDYKSKMSASVRASRLDPDIVQRHKDGVRKSYENPERREKAAQNMRYLSSNPESLERRKIATAAFHEKHGRKILCVETGTIFRFQREAVTWLRENGFPKATDARVSAVAKNQRRSAYGFTWRYA